MYKIVAITCGLLFFCTAASAQRFNIFVGYSYSGFGPKLVGYAEGIPLSPSSPRISHRLNGWNGSLETKVLSFLGIVADFSGDFGNETDQLSCSSFVFSCNAINADVSLYAFTVGPQVSLRWRRIEPFAHALFGGALYRDLTFSGSHTSFADVLGGGINVSVIPWLAWRAQADALQTRFSINFTLPNKQNSLRLSTGFVFRF